MYNERLRSEINKQKSEIASQMLALTEGKFQWQQDQAEATTKLTEQVAALQQVHHNENLSAAEDSLKKTLTPMWWAVAAAISVGLASPVIASLLTWWLTK